MISAITIDADNNNYMYAGIKIVFLEFFNASADLDFIIGKNIQIVNKQFFEYEMVFFEFLSKSYIDNALLLSKYTQNQKNEIDEQK